MPDERDHDLRDRVAARLLDGDLGVEDRPGLDLHEVRDHESEPAAAQAQHRVLLVHALDGGEELLVLGRGAAGHLGPGDLDELLLEVRQELVQRRVDEANDDGQPVHRPEDALEVALLEHLELGHRAIEAGDGRRVGKGGRGGMGSSVVEDFIVDFI